MLTWYQPSHGVLSRDEAQFLLDRGLTQRIRLDTTMIPQALALQAAGLPVIIVDGRAGNWPYSLAGDSTRWALQFDEGYSYEMAGAE